MEFQIKVLPFILKRCFFKCKWRWESQFLKSFLMLRDIRDQLLAIGKELNEEDMVVITLKMLNLAALTVILQ
jgi:5-enolpyruvylshikimate-3-phosphate synthase